jgi:hypothetical protein
MLVNSSTLTPIRPKITRITAALPMSSEITNEHDGSCHQGLPSRRARHRAGIDNTSHRPATAT